MGRVKTILPALIIASCAAAPAPASAPQAANDAEGAFKKMEAALASAKKWRLEFNSTTDGAFSKGTLAVDEGNKLEMKITGASGVKKYELTLTCDGAKMNATRSETPPPPVPLEPQPELPAPATLAANAAAALARGGAWLAQEFTYGEYRAAADPYFEERQRAKGAGGAMKPLPPVPPRDAAGLHTLSNFRTAGAGAVTYDLVPKTDGSVVGATMTVWIDSKSGLPTKREGQFFQVTDGKPTGAALSKWTETYKFN
jgi:outer membrane lipoprotein-sorting protein